MMIVSFGGGLGNQMFQYSFLISIEQQYKDTEIYADLMNVYSVDHGGYQLDKVFGIKMKNAKIEDIKKYSSIYPHTAPYSKVLGYIARIKKRICGVKKSHIFLDDNSKYSSIFYELNPEMNYYLQGVWANAKYLEKCEKTIKDKFIFNIQLNSQEREIETEIRNVESVSLHIRRGDYVGSDYYNLGKSYYNRAMEIIEKKVNNPHFFVFSDDIEYAKDMFGENENISYVVSDNRPAHIDMYFMSICKHNIIANSTFSFWGAYLNSNDAKVVICPDVWMPRLHYPLFCDGWTMIEKSNI